VPKKADANITYDLFFSGPEGFGEHIQVASDDVDSLIEGRAALLAAITAMGATPRWQDEKRKFGGEAPKTEMEAAAATAFGATQDIGTKNCPVDGTVMKAYPGGISRNKKDKHGNPARYGPRFVCGTCQNTIWANEN